MSEDAFEPDPEDASVLIVKVKMPREYATAVGKLAFLRKVSAGELITFTMIGAIPQLLAEVKAASEAKNLPSILP